jgi:repressor LexA
MPITKRQKQVLDFVSTFIETHGYAPSLEEIGRALDLSSVATVHKHLTNLQHKGLLAREWNRGRSLTVSPPPAPAGAVDIPLLGIVAAGAPIEAIANPDTLTVPASLIGRRRAFALARPGETVVALVGGRDATLKKFYRQGSRIRLQPANPEIDPIVVPESRVRIQGVVIGVLRRY